MTNKHLLKIIIFLQLTLKDSYHFSLPLQTSYTNEGWIMITAVTKLHDDLKCFGMGHVVLFSI